jgi:hypothetical protein
VKIGVVELCTLPLVATSQKTHVLHILATNKMENPFFNGNSKKPSYKSYWKWKGAHHCQKWGQDSSHSSDNIFYITLVIWRHRLKDMFFQF